MTQTRDDKYKNLNSFLSIRNTLLKWPNNVVFIINRQIKDLNYESKTIAHKSYIEYQTPYISLSKARNSLSRIARETQQEYDYFIHIDDDAYIYDYHLLMQSLLYLKRNNINCLIIGSICKPNLDPINKHIKNYKTFKTLNLYKHNSIMGSCICYGKDIINEKIFFDEKFGLGSKFGGSEETDFFINVLNKKIEVLYNPLFIVIHPPTFKNQYNFKKMYQYGLGRGAVYKKYINTYRLEMISFLLVSIIVNFGLFLLGLFSLQGSYSKRNIALAFGKIIGFIRFKNI